MTSSLPLQSLLERLMGEEAHLDRRLSYDLLRALLGRNGCHAWLYGSQKGNPHSSIDAAVALTERVMPGWAWSVGNLKSGAQAYLMRHQGAALIGPGLGATPALAICVTLLQALIASKSPSETDNENLG